MPIPTPDPSPMIIDRIPAPPVLFFISRLLILNVGNSKRVLLKVSSTAYLT